MTTVPDPGRSSGAVIWEGSPKLRDPLLIAAFEGWFDAGECATGAVEWMRRKSSARRVASIDPEEFFDFQESRPRIEIDENGERRIRWPTVDCHIVPAGPPHDLVLVSGIEPRMRWRSFCDSFVEIATALDCKMVVTLGATVSGVAHSRPAAVTRSAQSRDLAQRLGLDPPSYQGPTGIIGTLHEVLERADLPVVSLRVGVPHYVAGPPNPKGTRALLAHVEAVTGVSTGFAELDRSVELWESKVDEAVAQDPDIVEYISQLEQASDRAAEQSLPSGDDLAEAFQQFLASHDGVGQSGAGRPDAGQSGTGQSGAGQSGAGQSGAGQSGAGRSDTDESGSGEPDSVA